MKLIYTGHKSEDRTLALSRLNILVGPWGVGKSAAGDAMRIAALGCVPFLGSTHKATSALMRGDALEVVLDIGAGKRVLRRLERHGPRLKMVNEASWLEEAGDEATKMEILRLFGGEKLDVEEAFDIRALLGASANARAARLEALMNAGDPSDPEETAKAVALNVMLRLSEAKQNPKNPLTLLELIPDAQVVVLKGAQGMLVAKIKEGGISAATAWANQEKRNHSKEQKGKAAAAKEVEERLSGREVAEADLRSKELERDKLNETIGALRSEQKKARGWMEKVATEGVKIYDLEEAVKKAADARGENLVWPIVEKRERLQTIQKDLEESVPPQIDDDEAARSSESAAARHRHSAEAIKDPEVIDFEGLPLRIAHLKEEIKRARGNPWGQVSNEADAVQAGLVTYAISVGHDQGKKLPDECTPILDAVDALHGLAKDHSSDVGVMDEQLNHLTIELQSKESEKKDRDELVTRNIKRRQESIAQAERLEGEGQERRDVLAKDFETRIEQHATSTQGLRDERGDIEREIAAWEEKKEARKKVHDEKERSLDLARSRLKTLQEDQPESPQAVSEEVDRLDELTDKIKEMMKVVGAAQELKTIQEEIVVATAGTVAFKAIEWALQRQREKELEAAGASLTDIVEKFLKAAGREEEPYFDTAGGDCEIGWKSALGRVPVQAMSGGEWALFTAALQSSVVILRKGKVRILIVEAAEIGEHLPALCAGIESVASELSCVMVMTQARARPENSDSWNVIEMKHGGLDTAVAS